ncbi:acyltransferase [Plantibacter flavus]|uniref:acyltransferase family protein n=1 Tax=Plantibacter flavus TaxID=150123 RepID=UPI0010C1CCBC|nr:acyltransferase family protein [Plantibacter flavus]TKJ96934.1 acyltransferase [Plantibacter flavus]
MPSSTAVANIAAEGSKKSVFRPDIQGLRMLAVVAVILDHLLGWPSGGFIGVDVFFVISGFLITSLLLREHAKTGTISFTGFYARRIKRIMPAALLVILVTVGIAFLLFGVSRFRETAWDGVWAFFFSANWHFAAAGTDYFQLGGPVSPLQHYWSLAVEEQFYFVWPWLMLLIFWIAVKRGAGSSSGVRAAGIVMGVLVVASFVWALWETSNAPTWAYFSTFSRTWELGVGALIAVFASAFARISDAIRPVLAWLGIAGILLAVFIVSDEAAFPAPWAVLPVLATGLIIIAGTGGEQRYLWPLTNRGSRYVGDISYSLYLWHFPMIIFSIAVFGTGSVTGIIAALVATALLSVLSYHLVEDKVRRYKPAPPRRRRRQAADNTNRPYVIVGMSVLAAVTSVLVVGALTVRSPTSTYVRPAATGGQSLASPDPAQAGAPAAVGVEEDIRAALAADSWPELTPEIGDARSAAAIELASDQKCMHPSDLRNPDVCLYGDGDKTAIIIGDSVAVAWMSALRPALDGYKVRAIGFGSCPFVYTEILLANRPEETTRCNAARDQITALVQSMNPDMVILSNNQGGYGALASGAEGNAASAEWTTAREDAIRAVGAEGRQVVVISPPPVGAVPDQCATALSKPDDCSSGVGADWKAMVAADRAATDATGAKFVDALPWFCYDGRCPIFVGNTPVRTDQIHLTSTYGAVIAPLLRQALLS